MVAIQYKEEINKEAEAHIALGLLLRKERSEEKKRAVEEIFQSDLSVIEKAEEIRKSDGDVANKALPEEETGEIEQPAALPFSRVREMIKIPYKRVSYFTFLFDEYKKMKVFGKNTHIFNLVFFPPNVRLNPEIRSFIRKYLQPWAVDLLRITSFVLEIGWYYLQKKEYNLLVVFHKLCQRIVATNFSVFDYKDKNLINKLRNLETLFFMLHYRPEYTQLISTYLEEVLSKDPKRKNDFAEASNWVKSILHQDVTLPSFYNFILGLNMLKYKRFFLLKDLIRSNLKGIINSKKFECEPGVRKKINTYIQESKEKIILLHEQLMEIRRLKGFLTFMDSGEVDVSPIYHFYDTNRISNEYNSMEDRENIMVFTPRFLRIFEKTFTPLLNGKVTLAKIGRVELFSQSFFQLDFTQYRNLIAKLEKIAFSFPIFPLSRYLNIKNSKSGAIPAEIEFMMLINEEITILTGIGKKIEKILRLRRKNTSAREGSAPLERVALSGKPFNLPYENAVIKSKNSLNGKTVVESLIEAISISLIASVFFQETNISGLIRGEKKIDKDIKSILKILNRIADPKSVESIELLYT